MQGGLRGFLSALVRDRRGNFAMITAFVMPVAVLFAAFAVDVGSLYVEKRQAQGLVDLAAIAAAASINRSIEDAGVNAPQAALLAMRDNGATNVVLASAAPGDGAPGGKITVVPGHYDPSRSVNARFTPNATPSNAVRVEYETTGTRYFAGAVMPAPRIAVSAIANTEAQAAFSIGSRLVNLDGGLLNDLLSGLLGSKISLTVMDYNALLGANVSLLSFLQALAIDLDLTAASYDEVLNTQLSIGQLAGALSRYDGLPSGAKNAAGKLAGNLSNSKADKVRLGDLIDLGPAKGNLLSLSVHQIAAQVDVLQLLMASAMLSGQGKQIGVGLNINLPGLLKTEVKLAVGEPPQNSPWFRIGTGGELVRTAQTRLTVLVEVGGLNLAGLVNVSVRIPLYLELAYAEAKLRSISCPTGRPESARVVVDARPGVANLYLAEVDPKKIGGFASPVARSRAKIVDLQVLLSLVTVWAQAQAEGSNMQYQPIAFTASDISGGKIKQVETRELLTSLVTSLLNTLELKATLLNLIPVEVPAGVLGPVTNLLAGLTKPLDDLLVTLLSALGISLGQADVKVHAVSCGRAVLVQ